MNTRPAHFPRTRDVHEVLRDLEAEDERQKQALRKFYARNAAPHYSPAIRIWWQRLPGWEKRMYIGCVFILAASFLAVVVVQVMDR